MLGQAAVPVGYVARGPAAGPLASVLIKCLNNAFFVITNMHLYKLKLDMG